eukprot:s3379_g2.t5
MKSRMSGLPRRSWRRSWFGLLLSVAVVGHISGLQQSVAWSGRMGAITDGNPMRVQQTGEVESRRHIVTALRLQSRPLGKERDSRPLAMGEPSTTAEAVCVGRATVSEEISIFHGSAGPRPGACNSETEDVSVMQESGFLWRIAEDPRSLGVSQDLDSENDWEVPLERGVDMSASPSPAASQPVAPRRPSSVLAEERDLFCAVLTMMLPTRAEFVRGIPLRSALGGCGQALRGSSTGLYRHSRPASCIDVFWSHSWTASSWMKIATLRVLSSSFVPTACGTLGAMLALCLRAFNVLPSLGSDIVFLDSQWCLLFGMASYYIALLTWWPRLLVFLDVVCIDQGDEEKKGEALLCMGAILKSSSSMLVLWDPSWASRLWCIFELAGFLRSRESTDTAHRSLSVRPILMGPVQLVGSFSLYLVLQSLPVLLKVASSFLTGAVMVILTVAGTCLLGFLFLAHVARAYCRDLAALEQQLAEFKIEDTMCFCCTANHVNKGEAISCDRVVMCRCIESWFSSLEDFELYVQHQVRAAVLKQLTSPRLLYRLVVEAACPIMWFFLDRLAYALTRDYLESYPLWPVSVILDALVWWLAVMPSIIIFAAMVAYSLRLKPGGILIDGFASLLTVTAGVSLLVAFFSLDMLCQAVIPSQHPDLLPAKASPPRVSSLQFRWQAPGSAGDSQVDPGLVQPAMTSLITFQTVVMDHSSLRRLGLPAKAKSARELRADLQRLAAHHSKPLYKELLTHRMGNLEDGEEEDTTHVSFRVMSPHMEPESLDLALTLPLNADDVLDFVRDDCG